MFTWRRAKAAHAFNMEEGFFSIATNLPISDPLIKAKKLINSLELENIITYLQLY